MDKIKIVSGDEKLYLTEKELEVVSKYTKIKMINKSTGIPTGGEESDIILGLISKLVKLRKSMGIVVTKNWHKVVFVLGDFYEDGHGRYKKFHFLSNYSAEDIREAYSNAHSSTGLHFHSEHSIGSKGYSPICAEYQEYTLLEEHINKLRELEFDFTTIGCEENATDDMIVNHYITPAYLMTVHKFFLTITLKDLELLPINIENGYENPYNFDIGYGCFAV